MKGSIKRRKESGSIPIALLLAAAGLAVMMAQLVNLRGNLEKTAADRKKMVAEQSNSSAITNLKALLSHDGSALPVLFPEPYVGFTPNNSDSDPTNDAGFRTSYPQNPASDPLNTFGWKTNDEIPYTTTVGAPKRYRETQIHVVDPTTSNFVARYGNITPVVPYDMTVVTTKIMQANTANVGGITTIGSMDIEISTPDLVNPARSIKSKIRFNVPQPPSPTCTLDLIGNNLRLAAHGVATSASIAQSSPGSASSTVIATLPPSNNTPANSVFGQDVVVMNQPISTTTAAQTQTGPQGQPPVVTFTGTVSGPQGQNSTCTATNLTTVKLGLNFEDLADGGDMDFNDAVLCFKGSFRYTSDFVESAKNQDVVINVTNRSGCNHQMHITIKRPDGTLKQAIPVFTSRNPPALTVSLQIGDKMLVTMDPLPCSAPVTTRKVGDRISGGRNQGRYGAQLLRDQCNTAGN